MLWKIFFQVLKKALFKKVYSLKPVVMSGQNGLTDAVLDEINVSLNSHELIEFVLGTGIKMNVIIYVWKWNKN